MKLSRRFWILAVLLAACTATVETRARTVADAWLKAVDDEDLDKAWTLTDPQFKAKIGRQRWEMTIRKSREHGAVVTRKFLDAESAAEPLQIPPGDYVVVRHETKFAKQDAVEIVVTSRDSSGAMGVAAYLVSTRIDGG